MADRRLVEARTLKQRATALRNRGEFNRALDTLDAAIRVLETPGPDREKSAGDAMEVIAEIADIYGMKGGVFRRIPNFDAALAAYTTGAGIEVSKGLKSTYNRSNVIALSITLKETKPTDPAIRRQLASTIQTLESDTAGSRSDEWWAWADLAQYYLLNGEPEKARESHRNGLSKTGASAEETKRHALVLDELAVRTAITAPAISATIRAAIDELLQNPGPIFSVGPLTIQIAVLLAHSSVAPPNDRKIPSIRRDTSGAECVVEIFNMSTIPVDVEGEVVIALGLLSFPDGATKWEFQLTAILPLEPSRVVKAIGPSVLSRQGEEVITCSCLRYRTHGLPHWSNWRSSTVGNSARVEVIL